MDMRSTMAAIRKRRQVEALQAKAEALHSTLTNNALSIRLNGAHTGNVLCDNRAMARLVMKKLEVYHLNSGEYYMGGVGFNLVCKHEGAGLYRLTLKEVNKS